ncbi:tape measure protein [Nevskia sp.]|uniref:tape measure protein n=1 Tax=Nevskia sp. TaxID=1929292 RepID=UPI003F6E5BB8
MTDLAVALKISAVDLASAKFRKIATAVAATRDRLKAVEDTARQLRQYRELGARTQANAAKMQAAGLKVAELARRIRAAETPSKGLVQQFEAAKRSAGRLKDAHVANTNALGTLAGKLRAAGLSTTNLSQSERVLALRARKANDELKAQAGTLERARKSQERLQRIGSSARNLTGGAASGLRRAGGTAVRGAALAGGLGYLFNRTLIEPAAQYERFTLQLTALTGSAEKARTALGWISDFATRTPFEVEGLTASFTKLKAFGMDPLDGTLQALADQTVKLGGDQEMLDGIVLAVGQAWTKQKLQGEEALQLLERGVPVWDLLSEATGKSAVELQKLSSAGKLGRKEIKLLVDAIGRGASGAAVSGVNTWAGMVSNLSDQWAQFRLKVMQNGLFDYLKSRLAIILDTVNRMAADGSLDKIARLWGDRIQKALEKIWAIVTQIAPVIERLLGAVDAVANALGGYDKLLAIWIGGKLVAGAVAFAGALGGVAAAAGTLEAVLLPLWPVLAALAAAGGLGYLAYKAFSGPDEPAKGLPSAPAPGSRAASAGTGLIRIELVDGQLRVTQAKPMGGIDFDFSAGPIALGAGQ